MLGDGSFSDTSWSDISYPGATITSGNTIISNNVLGIFVKGGTQSYIATVPEPGTSKFFLLGLIFTVGLIVVRRIENKSI